jgi:hypothetical protein
MTYTIENPADPARSSDLLEGTSQDAEYWFEGTQQWH